MAKRRTSYSDIPAGTVYVSVYCTGRAGLGGMPAHQDRPWRIATYYLDLEMPPRPDGPAQWMEAVGQYWSEGGEVIVLGTAPTRTGMVGDRPVTQQEFRAYPDVFDGGSRSRYMLPCRQPDCGLSLAVRGDRLMPQLARVQSVGIREVSLAALAATIGNA